jgi:hypothetical protein
MQKPRRPAKRRLPSEAPPPVLIVNSRVTHYACLDADTGFNRNSVIFVGGKRLGKAPRLAIMLDGDGVYWLAHCTRTWTTRTAFIYDSLAAAKAAAEHRYPGSATRWIRTGYTKRQAEAFLDRAAKGRTCSFCGLRPDQTGTVFPGRQARICDACVTRFGAWIEALRAQEEAQRHWTSSRSFGTSVSLILCSSVLVLIDPVALHHLRARLQALDGVLLKERRQRLRAMKAPLRIGMHEIAPFTSGTYTVVANDLEPADDDAPGVVGARSGAIVITDIAALPAVARGLTPELFEALSTEEKREATMIRLSVEIGVGRFAILYGTGRRPFSGDGAYRLTSGAPAKVVPSDADRRILGA